MQTIRAAALASACAIGCAAIAPAPSPQTRARCGPANGAPLAAADPPARETDWQQTELFFGLSIPGGGEVSEAQFSDFVAGEICAGFPDGFTIVSADGAWRSPRGELVREPSRILLLLHPRNARSEAAIESIRQAYREAFHQESVLRVDEPAQVSF